ncbi:MAG: CoA transferase [Thermoanaerobacteraceae bacterium]|nr:CoA transferase [Thermoanaerobacteraceae bacterium]
MYQFLKEMRILDLTRLLPGPYATQLLGDLGAEVLKVEDPEVGDYMRWMEPCFPGTRESALFWGLNRNKKSMTLNLKSEAGREIFFKLVQEYDIVIEGFRPGVMAKLGLDFDTLQTVNPRVIMCSVTGYGQDGPYRDRAGHDINYNALAGSLGLTGMAGGPPVIPAVQIADIGGGALMAAVGILAAYISRQQTGRGQYIDVSMLDGVVSWMVMPLMQLAAGDPALKRGESMLNGGYPCYNVYRTRDGKYMSLGALELKFWKAFCRIVGREDLIPKQYVRDPQVKKEVQDIFAQKTRDEWAEVFADGDVCCEPVLDVTEIGEHPQVKHRKLLRPMAHPQAGNVNVTACPLKFDVNETKQDIRPPGFGEHTEEVLLDLGFSQEKIAQLKNDGVI